MPMTAEQAARKLKVERCFNELERAHAAHPDEPWAKVAIRLLDAPDAWWTALAATAGTRPLSDTSRRELVKRVLVRSLVPDIDVAAIAADLDSLA